MMRLTFALPLCLAAGCSITLFATAGAAEKSGAKPPAASDPAEASILAALDAPMSFSLHQTPLREFAAQLRERTQVNVLLDEKSLDEIGLSDETPLTGEFRNLALRSILNLVLSELRLTWMIHHGALTITIPEEEETRLLTLSVALGGPPGRPAFHFTDSRKRLIFPPRGA